MGSMGLGMRGHTPLPAALGTGTLAGAGGRSEARGWAGAVGSISRPPPDPASACARPQVHPQLWHCPYGARVPATVPEQGDPCIRRARQRRGRRVCLGHRPSAPAVGCSGCGCARRPVFWPVAALRGRWDAPGHGEAQQFGPWGTVGGCTSEETEPGPSAVSREPAQAVEVGACNWGHICRGTPPIDPACNLPAPRTAPAPCSTPAPSPCTAPSPSPPQPECQSSSRSSVQPWPALGGTHLPPPCPAPLQGQEKDPGGGWSGPPPQLWAGEAGDAFAHGRGGSAEISGAADREGDARGDSPSPARCGQGRVTEG